LSQPVVECVWPLGAELGEGPVWIAAEQAVYFVDIKAPAILRLSVVDGARASWPSPDQVGFIVPARGGGFVCGVRGGLHHFDPTSGAFTLIQAVEP
jgi:D-xylonolactonase